jgi:anti-sigma-K factor RskA
MSAHPSREEDFDLYALGALDADECGPFGEHLAACPECAAKLTEAKGRIALLAFGAASVAPASGAKQRLMARIDADAAAAQLPAKASVRSEERGVGFSGWWAAVLVPATAVLAIATIVLWQEKNDLDKQIAALRNSVTTEQEQLSNSTKLANLIGSSDTVTVNLAQRPGMPKGVAHVMYNMKMKMLMYDGELEAAPAGKSYQLWVVPMNGNPVSAGVFQPVPGQTDHWMMAMPEGLVPKAFAVTIEPAGGMAQPTGPEVLLGAAS